MKNTGYDWLREVLGRRKRLAGLIFVVSLSAAVGLVFPLPNLYRSTATMLVEGQQVPEAFVQSAVTSEIETRLNMITQKILSRSRLEELIQRFDLYSDLRNQASLETVMERMRKDIQPEFKWAEQRSGQRAAIAFTISYLGRDPQTVAQVANSLASFYIEENQKIRERQTTETAEVLWKQLQEVKDRLDQQMPQRQPSGENSSGHPDGLDPPRVRIVKLKQELMELRARYSEKYPDVIRIRTEIAALERQLGQEKALRRQSRQEPQTRDYTTTKELYDSLLKRYTDARLAENLEQRQQGEQFRILDPALPPEQPFAPNRIRLLFFSLVLSLGIAAGAVVLAERLDTSFHAVDDLWGFTKVPVLVTIPQVVTAFDSRWRQWRFYLTAVSVIVGLTVLVGASYHIADGNDQLVLMLARGRF